MSSRTGVLLVNLGTPKSPATKDVFTYLNEFLTDGRVIDIPWFQRQLLVRGIIVPFRARNSAKTYQEIWTDKGSPLMVYGRELEKLLQEKLGDKYLVSLGMRYQEPSIEKALEPLKQACCEKIIVLPLFPQYASATTGSVHQKVMEIVSGWQVIPDMQFINSFPTHPKMIEAFATIGNQYAPKSYDHVLFSFHGLPERHIRKADMKGHCLTPGCCTSAQKNPQCYRAQCVATAHAIAAKLDLPPDNFTVTFQSRLGRDPWLTPYTSETLKELAEPKGQRVLVFCPAFVCDCLETTFEIGEEYKEEFLEAGGAELQLVEGLNSHPLWIEALVDLVGAKQGSAVESASLLAP